MYRYTSNFKYLITTQANYLRFSQFSHISLEKKIFNQLT